MTTRIALVQSPASKDVEANVQRGLQRLREAADLGARLVCYAELSFTPFYPQNRARGDVRRLAEPIPGPTVERFQEEAARLGVAVVLNLFERAGDRCFDTSPVIDADGRLLGRTRMVHITEYEGFHEQGYYAPGDTGAPVYETRAAGPIGVAICYDRHFPEYMRALALGGAELVVVPQAGCVGEWPEGLYEGEMRTAAFQNGYYIALCNRVGPEEKLVFSGESFVTDPAGVVVARAGGGDELLVVDVDLAATAGSHARRLFMRHRRPELYAGFVGG